MKIYNQNCPLEQLITPVTLAGKIRLKNLLLFTMKLLHLRGQGLDPNARAG